jgi:hypothetical protein
MNRPGWVGYRLFWLRPRWLGLSCAAVLIAGALGLLTLVGLPAILAQAGAGGRALGRDVGNRATTSTGWPGRRLK